ncbi:unnamed protein product [Oikopleura dioica]|uniref:Uncharacterized protein n=1 Tax=Oikopleura dioica TaxID=34765 RepID=E4X7X3_OIKDI|nr:unnamed protein product [Oikopleura dioica]
MGFVDENPKTHDSLAFLTEESNPWRKCHLLDWARDESRPFYVLDTVNQVGIGTPFALVRPDAGEQLSWAMDNLVLGRLFIGENVIVPFLAGLEISLEEILKAAADFARFVNPKQTMGLQPVWHFPNLVVTARIEIADLESTVLKKSAADFFQKHRADGENAEWDLKITGFSGYHEASEKQQRLDIQKRIKPLFTMNMSGKVRELPFEGWKPASKQLVDDLTAAWVEFKFRKPTQTPATYLNRNILACVALRDIKNAQETQLEHAEQNPELKNNAAWLILSTATVLADRAGPALRKVASISELADYLIPEKASLLEEWNEKTAAVELTKYLEAAGMTVKDSVDMRKKLILLLRSVFQQLSDWLVHAQEQGVPGQALWFKNPEKWDLCNFSNPIAKISSIRALGTGEMTWVCYKIEPPRFVGFPKQLKGLEQPPDWRVLEPLLHKMQLMEERNSEGLPFRVSLYRKEKGAFKSKSDEWKQFLEMLGENSIKAAEHLWFPRKTLERKEEKKARQMLVENLAKLIPAEEPLIPGVFQMVWSEVFGNQEPSFDQPAYDNPRKLAWDPQYDHLLGLPWQRDSGPLFHEEKPAKKARTCWVGQCNAEVDDNFPICVMHAHFMEMAMDRRTASSMAQSLKDPKVFVVATERLKGRRTWKEAHPTVRATAYKELLAIKTVKDRVEVKTPIALLRAAAIRSHSGARLDWQNKAAQDQHEMIRALEKFASNWKEIEEAPKKKEGEPKWTQVLRVGDGNAFVLHFNGTDKDVRNYGSEAVTLTTKKEVTSSSNELTDSFSGLGAELGVSTMSVWEKVQYLAKKPAAGRWPELDYLEELANIHRNVKFVISCASEEDFELVKEMLTHRKTAKEDRAVFPMASRVTLLAKGEIAGLEFYKRLEWNHEDWALVPILQEEVTSFPQEWSGHKKTWHYIANFMFQERFPDNFGPENILGPLTQDFSKDGEKVVEISKRLVLLQAMATDWAAAGLVDQIRINKLDLELFHRPECLELWAPSREVLTEYGDLSPAPAATFGEWFNEVHAFHHQTVFFNNFEETVVPNLSCDQLPITKKVKKLKKKWEKATKSGPPNLPKTSAVEKKATASIGVTPVRLRPLTENESRKRMAAKVMSVDLDQKSTDKSPTLCWHTQMAQKEK